MVEVVALLEVMAMKRQQEVLVVLAEGALALLAVAPQEPLGQMGLEVEEEEEELVGVVKCIVLETEGEMGL
jgi:hypothetical protein